MSMLVSKLKALKVIEEECPEKLVNSLCCSEKTVKCLFRDCEKCQEKIILYNEFSASDSTSFNKWIDENVEVIIKGNKKQVKKATKKTFTCTIGDLVEEIEKNIITYMFHCGRIKGQYKAVSDKKENLQQDEIIIHIDFSENYNGKFSEEIQSVHFGGSRSQITLHTGVLYVKDQKPISFCTVSESKEHGSAAIWAHLKPVLHYIQAQFPQVKKIHFLSDSPSGQYRNKTMFHLTQIFLPKIFVGLESCSWNFSEAGHGKGAPDGVGGFIKRTADKCIAQGSDIMNITALLAMIKEKCQKMFVWRINQEEITSIEQIIEDSGKLSPVPGTFKLHQVSYNKKRVDYRTMSC
ncbi:hypothetical protein J6590_108690 [Homalodisca vitripennis]|nr:hypothetical protein J6590_108690 [Homalodisca vitripennis]